MALNSLNAPTAERKSDARFSAKPSFTSLIEGLIDDLKNLLRQEIRLAKHEIQEELKKAKTAAVSMGAGAGLAVLGGLLLVFMLVHLLQWLTHLPLWTCYGIVGGLCVAGGVFLLKKGKDTAADIHVVPPKTIQTMKENIAWIKDQT